MCGGAASQRTRVDPDKTIHERAAWHKHAWHKHAWHKFLLANSNSLNMSVKKWEMQPQISPCSHEERDTRYKLHYRNAVDNWHIIAYLWTVDTDVVALAYHLFPATSLQELWIWFGTGKHYKDIPIYNICEGLGPQRCEAPPFFHAFTSSDTTSFLHNVGPMGVLWRTMWDVMDQY